MKKLSLLALLLVCGLAHGQAIAPIPAGNVMCNAAGSVAYPAACATLPSTLLTASSVPIYSGSFTSGDCVEVNAASPVTLADTGAACGGSGSSGANPSATIGLTANNGSATTFLRSDGSPALSQAITPTWTGLHKFTNSDLALLGSSTGYTTFTSANASVTNYVLTMPAITDTLAALTATQTLTNKSIAGSEINSGTIPCAQLPALTGSVTTSGCATTVGTLNQNTTGTAANLSGTPALPNGTTATTQTTGDNTTKVATDAFVLANAASAGVSSVAAGGGIAVTGTGAGPYTGAVTVSASAPNRTVTSSPTVASTDMGGQINSNVTGGGTLTIPAISSSVFPANSTLTVVNYSASTEAVSTTPTVNAGGGCVSGTGIPAAATWNITSNGTTLDCNQTVSAGGGSGTVASSTTGQIPVYTAATTVTGSANATLTAGALTLGVSGTAGSVKMGNATSGTVTLQPVTGALGTVTASLPAATDTIVELTQTQTLTNKTISGSSNTLSNVALSSLATQAADTITANATGSTAAPTAVAIASTMMAYLQANTTFTITPTGCTPSAHAGGAFGGTITLATGPCTSIVVTMNGATGYTAAHGFDCSVDDQTSQAAGNWIPKWGQSAQSTTTATIPIPVAAGATDVISFSCSPN